MIAILSNYEHICLQDEQLLEEFIKYIRKVYGKGKVIPVLLTEHHAMKVYWRSGSIAPSVLDLGTR